MPRTSKASAGPFPFEILPSLPVQTPPSSSNSLTISNTNKGISAMPGPGSSRAPSFNGETADLLVLEFLKLFDDLAPLCALTNAHKCKMVVHYVDQDTKSFWVTLGGYVSKDYPTLKTNILAQYPGASMGVWYMIHDIEHIVLNTANSDISTETELLQYYRQFCPVAVWLEANLKISAWERNRYFWQGLPQTVWCTINQCLKLKEANYTRNEATNFEKVLEAGHFIFSDDAFDTDLNEPITSRLKSMLDTCGTRMKSTCWDSEDEEEWKDAPWEVHTKWVTFTPPPPPPAKTAMDEVKDLARKMHGLDIGDIAYSGCVISHTFALLIRSSGSQIQSDPIQIHYNKLLHSYPVHITLNTAYFLHSVYLPFWYIGYAYFWLCLLIRSPVINFQPMFDF